MTDATTDTANEIIRSSKVASERERAARARAAEDKAARCADEGAASPNAKRWSSNKVKAGLGIGSAAVLAALLYANHRRGDD